MENSAFFRKFQCLVSESDFNLINFDMFVNIKNLVGSLLLSDSRNLKEITCSGSGFKGFSYYRVLGMKNRLDHLEFAHKC